jgi:hypothetical protein
MRKYTCLCYIYSRERNVKLERALTVLLDAKASVTLTVFGRSCRVLTIDGLIRSKRAAGRPRDVDAIIELEALRELEDKS